MVRRSLLCAVAFGTLAGPALAGTVKIEGEAGKLAGFVTTSRFGKNPSVTSDKTAGVSSGGKRVVLSYCPPNGSVTFSNVSGGAGGASTVAMTFFNGGAEAVRDIDLYVNGAKVTTWHTKSARSRCSRFDAWWGTCGRQKISASVSLRVGANEVKLVSPDEDGVHVDFIEVTTR
jgi:hypothetical protein